MPNICNYSDVYIVVQGTSQMNNIYIYIYIYIYIIHLFIYIYILKLYGLIEYIGNY